MLKESYMENFYTYHSKYINNALALRPPQHDSLEIFARLCDLLSLAKNPTTTEQLAALHKDELDACATEDKRQKLLVKLASDAAADFYTDDLAAVRSLCPKAAASALSFIRSLVAVKSLRVSSTV